MKNLVIAIVLMTLLGACSLSDEMTCKTAHSGYKALENIGEHSVKSVTTPYGDLVRITVWRANYHTHEFGCLLKNGEIVSTVELRNGFVIGGHGILTEAAKK